MVRGIRTFSQDKELVEIRRREIVRFASKIFIRSGYQSTGMREIARSFGKSTGSLYHYVGSKEDILYLILEFVITDEKEYLAEIRRSIVGLDPTEALKQAISIYTRKYQEYADMHIFVNHVIVMLSKEERRIMLNASERVTNFFLELIQSGIDQGVFQTSNPKMVAWNIVIIGGGWVNRRWFWKNTYTLDEYIEQQTESIIKMLNITKTRSKSPLAQTN